MIHQKQRYTGFRSRESLRKRQERRQDRQPKLTQRRETFVKEAFGLRRAQLGRQRTKKHLKRNGH